MMQKDRLIPADAASRGGLRVILLAGVALLIAGVIFTDPRQSVAALLGGLTLMFMALFLAGIAWSGGRRARRFTHQVAELTAKDTTPCFLTDAAGVLLYRNPAADGRFGQGDRPGVHAALAGQFADPGAVLYRLQARAARLGAAQEDLVTRQGQMRLSVHAACQGRFLWRLDEFNDQPHAAAVMDQVSLPMIVANNEGAVLFANEALCKLVGSKPGHLQQIFGAAAVQNGEMASVVTQAGPLRRQVVELASAPHRREIYLLPGHATSNDQMLASHALASAVTSDDFEQVPVALIRFTAAGALRQANQAARDLLRLGVTDSATVTDLFEGLGRSLADWVADTAAGRIPASSEILRHRGAEQDTFFQVMLRRDVDRGDVGVLAILNDATALKTLEAQFLQSQKMQVIGQLAGGIAHDFNNLLTAISGHCDLLLLRHNPDDSEYADLVQIHQNANRAAALVGQLLGFSRKQMLQPERIDLQEVLSDLTHLLNRLVGERISLRLSHAVGLGPIRADKRQLEQVVMNLVVNARDAMAGGGTIRIETEALRLTHDLTRDKAVVAAGDYAVIRVLDTGCGIAADRLARIFEPFYTTKRAGEGTGLGLSMAYGIVKQSGGFIFCDSTVGIGTVFHLYFPINDTVDAPQPMIAAPNPTLQRRTGVILLVEDEAPVRAFASRALQLRGYTVLEAEDAEDALQILEDPQLDVDVFVTDVVMPGMDGPTWVRRALQDRADVRVVFMSGYAEESLSESQARIPNSVFLPKPFSLTELVETVQSQLH